MTNAEQLLARIDAQVEQASELSTTHMQEQSQGLGEVRSAIENLSIGVNAQEKEALLQKQRMGVLIISDREGLLTGLDSCTPF